MHTECKITSYKKKIRTLRFNMFYVPELTCYGINKVLNSMRQCVLFECYINILMSSNVQPSTGQTLNIFLFSMHAAL